MDKTHLYAPLYMNEVVARATLGDKNIQADREILSLAPWIRWRNQNDTVTLEGEFSAHELQALAWWMITFGKDPVRD